MYKKLFCLFSPQNGRLAETNTLYIHFEYVGCLQFFQSNRFIKLHMWWHEFSLCAL